MIVLKQFTYRDTNEGACKGDQAQGLQINNTRCGKQYREVTSSAWPSNSCAVELAGCENVLLLDYSV